MFRPSEDVTIRNASEHSGLESSGMRDGCFFSCARLVVTTRFEKQNSLSALGIYPPLCSLLKGEAFMTSSNGGNIKHRIAAI